jgi:hypothetical protein
MADFPIPEKLQKFLKSLSAEEATELWYWLGTFDDPAGSLQVFLESQVE